MANNRGSDIDPKRTVILPKSGMNDKATVILPRDGSGVPLPGGNDGNLAPTQILGPGGPLPSAAGGPPP